MSPTVVVAVIGRHAWYGSLRRSEALTLLDPLAVAAVMTPVAAHHQLAAPIRAARAEPGR